jgi:malate permease and related proteins
MSGDVILGAITPVFILMGLGFWLRRRQIMPLGSEAVMVRLTVEWAYPALILRKVLLNPALKQPGNVMWPLLIGAGVLLISLLVSDLVAGALGLERGQGRRSFALANAVQNYSYLPILGSLLPDGRWSGVLFVYALGIELVLWTLGLVMLTGDWRQGLRRIINPVVGAVLMGLVLNLSGGENHLPSWLLRTLELLGGAAVPMGLVTVGCVLADVWSHARVRDHWGLMSASVFLRLCFFPVGLLACAQWLPCSTELKQVLAVQAAMPAAVFPLVMARHYGGHEATVARCIIVTTLVSLLTAPFVLSAAWRWLGLSTSVLP